MLIHLLVKMCEKPEYATDLLKGKLFANRLSFFRESEDDGERKDEYEGVAVLNSDGVTLRVEVAESPHTGTQEVVIGDDSIVGPIEFRLPNFDDLNLYCMSWFQFEDFKQIPADNAYDRLYQLEPPEDFLGLGRYAVAIADTDEFMNRVKNAAARNQYELWSHPVQYFDPAIGVSYDPRDLRIAFSKRDIFAYQKEFRIAVFTKTSGHEPITLDIGRIDDIAFALDTDSLVDVRWRFQNTTR